MDKLSQRRDQGVAKTSVPPDYSVMSPDAKGLEDRKARNSKLLRSFIQGTRWMIALSILVLPVSYLNSILLGRISPKALGLYGLLLLAGSLTTLFLFGGSQTLVKFLPSTPADRRIPFVLTYGLLVCGVAALLLIAIAIDPGLLSLLVRRDLDPRSIRYLFPFVPLILLVAIFRAILQARMEVKWMTIATKVVPLISFAGFAVLYLLWRYIPDELLGEAILVIFCVAQLVSIILAAYQVYTRFIKVEPLSIGLFLPSDFWRFGSIMSLSMVVILILNNFDQVLVFSQFEIDQLGIYRASLTTAEFVRWLPVLSTQAVLPLFSHLLADDQQNQIHVAYRRVMRYNTLATCAIALIIVLFSQEILRLFGNPYLQAEGILVLLAGVFVLSGISTVNSSFIVATGRVELGLISGVVGAVLQIAISLMLIEHLGTEGAAIGKAMNFVGIFVLNAWFANRIAGLKPDRRSVELLGLFFLALLLSRFVKPESMALTFTRNGILLSIFVAQVLRWFDYDDYRHLRSLVLGRFEG